MSKLLKYSLIKRRNYEKRLRQGEKGPKKKLLPSESRDRPLVGGYKNWKG